MKKRQKLLLWLIILISLAALVVDLPREKQVKFSISGREYSFNIRQPKLGFEMGKFGLRRKQLDLDPRYGLDIQGGLELTLEADMTGIGDEDKDTALESAREVVARRVDLFGVTEPSIRTVRSEDKYRILVELPGMENVDEAIALIGKTAQLDFREPKEATPSAKEASPSAYAWLTDYKKTGLTGADLKQARVQFDPNSGKPVVALEFSQEGAKKFAQITERNVGRQVGIYLDDIPITMPRVNEPIRDGSAVISGDFDTKTAKDLTIQLNAGALPVPINIVGQRLVEPTLGRESIEKSVKAGLIGLVLVVLFMWSNYGKAGFLADVALVIYGLLTYALYKLIPVTLTLPGIAGFLLSVGMAVDSNILIFERMKEELRAGKDLKIAMELGFGRAWDSIKDANVCTLITCFVLFNPLNSSLLNTSGMVRGFALTLGLGVIVSLFTGIVVTRTLMRSFYSIKKI